MATFEVKVVAIDAIEEHPNADAIEIAVIGGYRSIVKKHTVAAGDLVVYIPEASVLPEWFLKEMGFWDREKGKGTLAGKQGNRVKIAKLRGVISQGIIYPVDKITHTGDLHWVMFYTDETLDPNNDTVVLDEDVMDRLGMIKYEPVIPTHMQGEVCSQMGLTVRYDIENIQKWMDVIEECEPVAITEKLHGTWTCFGCVPHLDDENLYDGEAIISSKGLSERGLAFKWAEENRQKNLYVRMFEQVMLGEALDEEKSRYRPWLDVPTTRWDVLSLWARQFGMPYYILGEIYGPGVQGDFNYGLQEKQFRVFDIYAGTPGQGRFLGFDDLLSCTKKLNLPLVPILRVGRFSMAAVAILRDGLPVEGGKHVREGIVVKPVKERQHEGLGRVCLKYVSPDYLLRKGKNVTEFN